MAAEPAVSPPALGREPSPESAGPTGAATAESPLGVVPEPRVTAGLTTEGSEGVSIGGPAGVSPLAEGSGRGLGDHSRRVQPIAHSREQTKPPARGAKGAVKPAGGTGGGVSTSRDNAKPQKLPPNPSQKGPEGSRGVPQGSVPGPEEGPGRMGGPAASGVAMEGVSAAVRAAAEVAGAALAVAGDVGEAAAAIPSPVSQQAGSC